MEFIRDGKDGNFEDEIEENCNFYEYKKPFTSENCSYYINS